MNLKHHPFDSSTTPGLAAEFNAVVGSSIAVVSPGLQGAKAVSIADPGDYLEDLVTESGELFLGMKIKFPAVGSTTFVEIRDGGIVQAALVMDADGTVFFMHGPSVGSAVPPFGGLKLGTNTTYSLELRVVMHGTDGLFELRVDGVTRSGATGINTAQSGNAAASIIRWGGGSLAGGSIIDELYVNNTAPGRNVDFGYTEDDWHEPPHPEDPDNPLLLPGGSSAVPWESGVEAMAPGAVLATDGAQRHTRVVFERSHRPGVYRYTLMNADKDAVERVLRAVKLSRGGASSVLYRAPVDDAIASPPRQYRIMNTGLEVGLELRRHSGGALADVSLVLEQV